MSEAHESTKGQPTIGEAALFGLCPRCGAKSQFAGLIRFADRCPACGLDYGRFNVGDGPAAFLTMIIGTIVVIGALWLQLGFEPPWWVHVMLWVPITVGGVVLGLRLCKAWLLTLEYRRRAEEHRHEDGADK